jgi:predicted methyltransferase
MEYSMLTRILRDHRALHYCSAIGTRTKHRKLQKQAANFTLARRGKAIRRLSLANLQIKPFALALIRHIY